MSESTMSDDEYVKTSFAHLQAAVADLRDLDAQHAEISARLVFVKSYLVLLVDYLRSHGYACPVPWEVSR